MSMSNIREVSRVAGVSTATVSRALSSPEKVSKEALRKVHKAIEEVQYRPNMMARNFRFARAYTIVVLVPNINSLFFANAIRGIEDIAQQKGYSVLLGDTRDLSKREQSYMNLVETRQADGIIQLRPHRVDLPTPPQNIPIINACGCENTPYPSVRIDNSGASKTAIDYLISQGHKRIGVISGLRDNPHTIDRLEGYKLALAQSEIPFEKQLIAEGDFTMQSGLNAVQHFIHMPQRPTALFCMNDEMAIGAIHGLKNNNIRIPDDMSIVGFDNIEFAKFSDPPLTTIAQPAEELGKIAMTMLLRKIEGEELTQSENILPYELVVRKSTMLNNQ